MGVRAITTVGDPVLRERAREVTPDELSSPEVQQLIDDLIATMRAAGGAGLAANQIGELVRIAVIEVDDNPRYPYKPPIPLTVIVNPVTRAARRRNRRDQRGLPVGARPARHRGAPPRGPSQLSRPRRKGAQRTCGAG